MARALEKELTKTVRVRLDPCCTSCLNVLDNIGLCPEEIEWRRQMWSFPNKLRNQYLKRRENRKYITGSRKGTFDFYYSHGPAISPCGTNIAQDHVRCVHTSWPPQAKEWIGRVRPSNFPPLDLIHSAEEEGVFVVPVGHKASAHKDIEWRFSFSLLELKLIQMWPVNATRCYFVLKLLKDFITNLSELLDGTLCSYHMKTLMFWLVEETGIDYWLNHSLMECLMFSLTRLCKWIGRGFIPQYFVLENNILDVWNDEP
ncbi:hypothetical protein ScPMuIL_005900 [Solemya velum]